MLNSNLFKEQPLKATNINSSLTMKGLNQAEVEKRRRIRTNAEMADVTRMGEEIEAQHFNHLPMEYRTDARKRGADKIQLSHNKNSTPLEGVYSSEWWSYIAAEVRNHWNEKAVA
tara:strand:+ start:428 stop:772 length:345 start_codon:yes stop_codon:yes gene_type:complete